MQKGKTHEDARRVTLLWWDVEATSDFEPPWALVLCHRYYSPQLGMG